MENKGSLDRIIVMIGCDNRKQKKEANLPCHLFWIFMKT